MTSSEGGEEKLNRKKFEAEYIAWVENAAKEIAETLKTLDVSKISEIIEFHDKKFGLPASMHQPLDSEEKQTVEELIGKDRLKDTIVLKNRALIFAPSILVPSSTSLDYGTAMHRRFFLRGLWFSIIALNEAYLKSASELMLKYIFEHELAQGELYKELAEHQVGNIGSEIKGAVHEEARIKAIRQSAISEDEVERERQLILKLSTEYPVVPVQFASASLFMYLEENLEELKQFGVASKNEKEKELEPEAQKISDWTDFALNLFELFLTALKKEMTMTGVEYGAGIV
jgi:hypothetical protein